MSNSCSHGQQELDDPAWLRRLKTVGRFAVLILVAMTMMACSPRHMIVQGVAGALASQGLAQEDDLVLARDASAFYLKLSESLLLEAPGHLPLAEAVASGFTQYAYAFVQFEADRVDAQDARTAEKLRKRAARLYARAQRHALHALEQSSPGFAKNLASPHTTDWPHLRPEQIGTAYWAAASWGALISLSKDDPNTVADLPLAHRLAGLAWQVEPNHARGGLASLMGSFEAARPGGSKVLAARYFDWAIDIGAGKNAGAFVAKAEGIALPAGDRVGFDRLLKQALAASDAQRDLPNGVMRERAVWMLETADDLFLP